MCLGSSVIHWGTVARNDAPEPKLCPTRGAIAPGTYMTALGMLNLSAKALAPTNVISIKAMSGPNAYSQHHLLERRDRSIGPERCQWGYAKSFGKSAADS